MYRSPACLLAPDRLSPTVGHGSDRADQSSSAAGGSGHKVNSGTVGLDLAPDGERAKPERGEHDELLHSEEPSTSMTSERAGGSEYRPPQVYGSLAKPPGQPARPARPPPRPERPVW